MLNKIKENWIIIALCLLVFAYPFYREQTRFVVIGDKKTHIYHIKTCPLISKDSIVFKNPNEAVKNGYRPCHICKPPEETPEVEQDHVDKYYP